MVKMNLVVVETLLKYQHGGFNCYVIVESYTSWNSERTDAYVPQDKKRREEIFMRRGFGVIRTRNSRSNHISCKQSNNQ